MFLLYGVSDMNFVQHPVFHKLQLVKSRMDIQPQHNRIDVSEFLGRDDILGLVDLLMDDSVPSNVFPVEEVQVYHQLQNYENILRFATFYADELLISRMAERFFGMINSETKSDFLRLVYNCKGGDEDSAMVLRVFFCKQAEIVSKLSPEEQGLFLSTFSGLVPANVEIFKLFNLRAFQSVKCIRLEVDESEWKINGLKFILGNGFVPDTWTLESQDGNAHLEIALHLIQPDFDPKVSDASSFLQFLSAAREGLKEEACMQHITAAIQFALDFGFFDLVFEWFNMLEAQNILSYSMSVSLLERGIKDNNLEITIFACKKLNDMRARKDLSRKRFDPISNAIQENCSIEVFEALFPLAEDTVTIPINPKKVGSKSHLQRAIESERSDIALTLLEKGADPKQVCGEEPEGYPLRLPVKKVAKPILMLAIEKDMVEVVRELLLRGADVNSIDLKNLPRKLPILEVLLQYVKNYSETLLDKLMESAALDGNLDVVLFLESKGAKCSLSNIISFKPSGGVFTSRTPIAKELTKRGNSNVLIHFLEKETDLTENQFEDIWSSFLLSRDRSSHVQRIEIMNYLRQRNEEYFPRLLIEKHLRRMAFGTLQWLLDTFGESLLALSPLHSLLELKCVDLVREILRMRPDLILTGKSTGQPLISQSTSLDWFYDLDFDSTSLPNDAIYIALRDSRFKDFQRLCKEGVSWDSVDDSGKTVLHLVASIEDIETLSFIRENLAIESLVNEVDSEGNTCLHYAVQNETASHALVSGDQNEKVSFISFLVLKVADVYQKNIYGQSPLKLALNDCIRNQLLDATEDHNPPKRMDRMQ